MPGCRVVSLPTDQGGVACHMEMTEEQFESHVRSCRKKLGVKNGILTRKFGVGKHPRWDFDYTTGILSFGPSNGPPAHRFRAFGLGTYSAKGFKWTWASKEVPADARAPSERLKSLEQTCGVPAFGVPTFQGDEWMIQSFIAMAIEELGLMGCYLADGPSFGTAIAIEALLDDGAAPSV